MTNLNYTKRNSKYIKESWNKVKPKEIVKTNLKQRKIISVKCQQLPKIKEEKKERKYFFQKNAIGNNKNKQKKPSFLKLKNKNYTSKWKNTKKLHTVNTAKYYITQVQKSNVNEIKLLTINSNIYQFYQYSILENLIIRWTIFFKYMEVFLVPSGRYLQNIFNSCLFKKYIYPVCTEIYLCVKNKRVNKIQINII